MTIYFIEMEGSEAIKIGRTDANDVTQRMRQLQTGQPAKLRLIGTIEGGAEVERNLHEQFADLRINGEWFRGPSSFRWFLSFMCERQLPWQFCRAYAMLDAWREEVLSEISAEAKEDWRDKQIARQHRQKKDLQEKVIQLQARVQQLQEAAASTSNNKAFTEPFEPAFYA